MSKPIDLSIKDTAFYKQATEYLRSVDLGDFADAPADNNSYARRNRTWEQVPASLPDAPSNGSLYARKDGAWELAASPVFDFYYDATITYEFDAAPVTKFLIGDIPSSYQSSNPFLQRFYIGNSVTSIGDSAFAGNSSLAGTIIIPNNVTSIEAGAFGNVYFSTIAVINGTITSVGGLAGDMNPSLGTLYVNQPFSVWQSVFSFFNSVGNVYVGPDATGWTIGNGQTLGDQFVTTDVAVWSTYPQIL